jgi:hypothetical protein
VPKKEKPVITDENGELDELKCLQALMTPQLCSILINGSKTPQKSFAMLIPADSFYTELHEGYVLRLVDSVSLGKPE